MITDLSQLDPDGIYTYTDYLTWRLQERIELIKGKIFKMSPAPSSIHQELSWNLTLAMGAYFQGKPCKAYSAPFDVRLPIPKGNRDYTVVQPDLCVICDLEKIDARGCNGAPDLVVEILSPGNAKREMREKYEVYEEAGVREYWLVSLSQLAVTIYVLNEEGKFIGLQPYTQENTLVSSIFPDLKVDLWEVFPEALEE